MTIDEYLRRVIDMHRGPSGEKSPSYKAAHEIVPMIQEWAVEFLEGVYFSGSFAKETNIVGSADLDLFISLKSSADRFTLQHIYNSLHDHFQDKGFETRNQNVSIGMKYYGLDVDLVPGRIQRGYQRYHSLYKSKTDSWTQTNIHEHIKLVKNSGRLDEIRGIKIWKKLNGLDFPSIYLELSVIRALKFKIKNQLANNLISVFEYLANDFVESSIIDPANTANRISDDLNKTEKRLIARKARETLNQSRWENVIW